MKKRATFDRRFFTWMMIYDEELNILEKLIKRYEYPAGNIKIEKIDGETYALIEKPKPFYGENYTKWEKIKYGLYNYRNIVEPNR